MAANDPSRMSDSVRLSVRVIALLLWISGCGWMIAHFFFQQRNDFGEQPSGWEPSLLHAHGMLAVGGVFIFGWIASRHIAERWNESDNRVSGLTLAAATAILVISGYLLYYVADERSNLAIASIHEVLGVLALVFAQIHWRIPNRQRKRA
jgi:hypothetical protein